MASTQNILISGFIALLAMFFMITGVIYPASSPATTMSHNLNLTATLFEHSPLVQVTGVSNATVNCSAGNFTITSTTIARASEAVYCKNGTYTIAYEYQNDPYVVGIDFGFVVVLLILTMLILFYKKFK